MKKLWRILTVLPAVLCLIVPLWAEDHAVHEVPQYGVKIAIRPGPNFGEVAIVKDLALAVGWRQKAAFRNVAISIQTTGGKYRAYLTEGLGPGAKEIARAIGPTEPGQPLFPRRTLEAGKAYYIVIIGTGDSDRPLWKSTKADVEPGAGVESLGTLSARAGNGEPYTWNFSKSEHRLRYYVTAQWNHNPNSETGGPESWSKLGPPAQVCGNPTGQSPIDIERANTRYQARGLTFHYDNGFRSEIENLGYTIEAVAAKSPGHKASITYQGKPYTLAQFHVHAPSEHTLDGKSYDFEVHLVHKGPLGALAVVGVLFNRSADARQTGLDTAIRMAPETVGGTDEQTIPLDFIPKDAGFYFYDGSLTTPACDVPPVQFIIAATPQTLSAATVDRLHDLIRKFPFYDKYENNNRPIQPDNKRPIFRSVQ